jgi:nitric oxide reductase activation protein
MLVGTERGRAVVRRIAENFIDAPESFEEWNDAAIRELESIQSALDSLSQALGVRPAAQ